MEENEMEKLDSYFMEEMKPELNVNLLGVASFEMSTSQRLKEMATSLLPGIKFVVVLGKEIDSVAFKKKFNSSPQDEIYNPRSLNIPFSSFSKNKGPGVHFVIDLERSHDEKVMI